VARLRARRRLRRLRQHQPRTRQYRRANCHHLRCWRRSRLCRSVYPPDGSSFRGRPPRGVPTTTCPAT
jgi:hypothetical protein